MHVSSQGCPRLLLKKELIRDILAETPQLLRPDPKWDTIIVHFLSYNTRQMGLQEEIQRVL